MSDTDRTDAWDGVDEYAQRMLRRKLRNSALHKIRHTVDEVEQQDRYDRQLALNLIGLFIVVAAGILGIWVIS